MVQDSGPAIDAISKKSILPNKGPENFIVFQQLKILNNVIAPFGRPITIWLKYLVSPFSNFDMEDIWDDKLNL